jgi:hypothetical protein
LVGMGGRSRRARREAQMTDSDIVGTQAMFCRDLDAIVNRHGQRAKRCC